MLVFKLLSPNAAITTYKWRRNFSLFPYSSYLWSSCSIFASMVKHHKRKAVPTVQRVTWVDKVTTRGVSTRQIRVSTPKTVHRSSPAKPSGSPWTHGSSIDIEEQCSSVPLMLPKKNVSSYFFKYQTYVTIICKIRHKMSICSSGYQRETSISLI